MTEFSDERGAELRELFFETAREMLQSLNEEALKLEKGVGDSESVRSIRRIVHTLKGDAAACGYRELSELAHELEDALETPSSHAALAEVAFTAADVLDAMLGAYRQKAKLPSAEPLRKMIRALVSQPAKRKRPRKKIEEPVAHAVWTEYEKLAIQHALGQSKSVYHITAQIDPHCAMPIAARQLLQNALAGIGEVLGARPGAGAESVGAVTRLEFVLASDQTTEQVTAKCSIPSVTAQVQVKVMKGQTPKAKAAEPGLKAAETTTLAAASQPSVAEPPDEPASAAKLHSVAAAENILRVDAERIDNVLNLVGELIIGKSMLQQSLNDFSRRYAKDPMRGRFADAVAHQARVLNDLQRSVMKIRMVPVEQLFRRFPRLVRDVAKQCGKEVELVISGEGTDLDKSLLDAIAEPLTHLVRNAVSHGIESAEGRRKVGKPAHGTIRLDAYHQGNQVVVEIHDDGRGIDAQKVKAKALEQGLLSAEEAARCSEPELLDLVFRPGFSTAEEITEIAGRGVGLDVVQSVLHRLKGTVEIETRAGQGATFRLKLPLTLAIIKALLFRVEQRLYAIALNTVAEIARTQESELHQVDNYEVLQLRNQVLPLVRLGRPPDRSANRSRKVFVLVITVGERKLGLIVDAMEGEEELVIKALDSETVATDLVSGASVLGDGRVVLILNLAAIMDRYARSRPEEAGGVSFGLLLSQADRTRIAQGASEVRS